MVVGGEYELLLYEVGAEYVVVEGDGELLKPQSNPRGESDGDVITLGGSE